VTGPLDDDPDPGALADDADELDWDVDRDGRMREFASDDTPQTIPLED